MERFRLPPNLVCRKRSERIAGGYLAVKGKDYRSACELDWESFYNTESRRLAMDRLHENGWRVVRR